MFHEWENFYIIIGPTAGALIGLMFVVATLTAGFEARRAARGARIFFTPIVFHFGVVVTVSAITAVPELSAPVVGVLFAVTAVFGGAYTILTLTRILRSSGEDPVHWSDKYFYGVFPVLAYVVLAVAAAAMWFAPHLADYATGAAVLGLLLIGIRDAWDLQTYLVQDPRRKE
jgi:hypothetical protein